MSEFLQAVHETTFKSHSTDALLGVCRSLGTEAAWHYWGTVYSSFNGPPNEPLCDARRDWLETARRLDSKMARFSCILDRWSKEKSHELEQERLEREEKAG